MTKEFDQFQAWLMDMDDALERLIRSIPNDLSPPLNWSGESLKSLEQLILSAYPTVADAKEKNQAKNLDEYARYIGELFRKHFGGKWKLELDDKKNAYYGLPQIVGMKSQQVQFCPLALVTTAVDRRTGETLSKLFANYQKRKDS